MTDSFGFDSTARRYDAILAGTDNLPTERNLHEFAGRDFSGAGGCQGGSAETCRLQPGSAHAKLFAVDEDVEGAGNRRWVGVWMVGCGDGSRAEVDSGEEDVASLGVEAHGLGAEFGL